MTLFTTLIEERDDREPFVQVYWARAPRLGEAIQMMLTAATKNGLKKPFPRQCDPYDIENLPSELKSVSDNDVFWNDTRHLFPPEESFDLPIGIIASCIEGDFDIDEIKAGYTIEKEDDQLTNINVNVECDRLASVYADLLGLYPQYRVFWYLLHKHWNDDAKDLFFVNEALSTPARILEHIENNAENSIQNGFVTLTAYLEEGATNLNISDHQRISIKTHSESIVEQCTSFLNDLGYPQDDSLVSIDTRMHHWHYRVPESLSKKELVLRLKELGFTTWEPKVKP